MRIRLTRVVTDRPFRRPRRLRLAAAAVAASLALAACGTTDDDGAPSDPPAEDGDPDDGDPDDGDPDDGDPDDGDPDDGADSGDDADGTDGAGDDDAAGDGTDEDDTPGDEVGDDDGDDGVEPLAGDPTTDRQEESGAAGTLAVTDVRIGQHDGFDRVVFDLAGDAEAGWIVEYVDEAIEQGRGRTIEVEGDATLRVAIRMVTLPPELPDDIEVWDHERLAAPDGAGAVVEVVDDTIFEGQHVVFVGTTGEHGFLIERFEDPQRVVLDVFHG